jgi:hypothetical protein
MNQEKRIPKRLWRLAKQMIQLELTTEQIHVWQACRTVKLGLIHTKAGCLRGWSHTWASAAMRAMRAGVLSSEPVVTRTWGTGASKSCQGLVTTGLPHPCLDKYAIMNAAPVCLWIITFLCNTTGRQLPSTHHQHPIHADRPGRHLSSHCHANRG